MRVLVLGAYGLLGLEVVRRLKTDFDIVGLGRSAARARAAAPDIAWIIADMARMGEPGAWREALQGVSAVVNAAGALQDGPRDNLAAVQDRAVRALIAACEAAGVKQFVQISAPAAAADADTRFLRTKGLADAALRQSALDWIVFKPGLVISANSYGGTSLVRMLAAFPVLQPLVLGQARIQTVAASDVAEAVSLALARAVPPCTDYDLVSPAALSLREIVGTFRAWLGFAPARLHLEVPAPLGFLAARGADLAGLLGWRSPLRTTALKVLAGDVLGDPAAWAHARGAPLKTLDETLAALPATAQERMYARASLAFPFLLLALSAFWLASGAIGLVQHARAAALLKPTMLAPVAEPLVFAGGAADIAIGAALLARPLTHGAAWTAFALALSYLIAGAAFAPGLLADPLGPLVKILPALGLSAAVAALAGER